MAKIKNPLNSVQASGTAGGVTYARNHYGQYARTWFSPVQPNTASQLSWRAAMAQANTWYQDPVAVFPVSITRWQQFAQNYTWTNQFGKQVRLSAKEWFIKHNIWKAISGGTILPNPPLSPSLNYFPEITIFWDTAGIFIEVFPAPVLEQFVYVRKAGPVSHTRNFCPNEISFAGMVTLASGSPILLVPAIDIDTNPHNWFFIVRILDHFARSSNKIYFKVFTEGTAPTAVFAPNTQTFLREDQPTTNQSTVQRWRIRGANITATMHGLCSVDLSGLTYTYVDKSYLYLWPESTTSILGSCTFHQDLSSYVFDETTWNLESTGVPWGAPGGTSGTDYDNIPFAFFSNDQSILQWYRVDITNQMNAWLSGTTPTRFWGIASTANSRVDSESINNAVPEERPFILNVPNVAV